MLWTKRKNWGNISQRRFDYVLYRQYVCALLGEKNEEKAEIIKAQFEKRAKTYPYQNEMQSERELMAIAENCETAKKDA